MDGTFEPGTTMQYSRDTPGLDNVPVGAIRFGVAVESADINDDGAPDLIVGADQFDAPFMPGINSMNTGAVFLIARNSSGLVTGLA